MDLLERARVVRRNKEEATFFRKNFDANDEDPERQKDFGGVKNKR